MILSDLLASTASILIHYLPQLKDILVKYQKSISICASIIQIVVLISQIGEQTRLSILQSNILQNIDTVVCLQSSNPSLLINVFSLFYELSDSSYGCDCLIQNQCYEICYSVIQQVKRSNLREREDIINKVLSVIQRTVEKGKKGLETFENSNGLTIIMKCYDDTESISLKENILNCINFLLQLIEKKETIQTLHIISWLFNPSHTTKYKSIHHAIWLCCRSFIQFHASLLNKEDFHMIINYLLIDCKEYLQNEGLMNDIVTTLHAIIVTSSFIPYFQLYETNIKEIISSLHQQYKSNEFIEYQLTCIESTIATCCNQQEFSADSKQQSQVLIQQINQSLQNPQIPQEEMSNLLDILLEVCINQDLIRYLSISSLPSTLESLFSQELENDNQNKKILSIVSSLQMDFHWEDDLLLNYLRDIDLRLKVNNELSIEYCTVICLFIEIACNKGNN